MVEKAKPIGTNALRWIAEDAQVKAFLLNHMETRMTFKYEVTKRIQDLRQRDLSVGPNPTTAKTRRQNRPCAQANEAEVRTLSMNGDATGHTASALTRADIQQIFKDMMSQMSLSSSHITSSASAASMYATSTPWIIDSRATDHMTSMPRITRFNRNCPRLAPCFHFQFHCVTSLKKSTLDDPKTHRLIPLLFHRLRRSKDALTDPSFIPSVEVPIASTSPPDSSREVVEEHNLPIALRKVANKMDTIRILISFVANFGWELHQLVSRMLFFMASRRGKCTWTVLRGSQTMLLIKCVDSANHYVLKQTPRAWFGRFSKAMLAHGYCQSNTDHTLFIRLREKLSALLIIYV
ncbi:hypothetical protein AKJ16_DCAP05961 [Drosera capensis]